MISKIMEFKIAIWDKAGKYTASRGQRILLTALIGIGMITWAMLRFIGTVLNATLEDDKKDKWSFPRSQEKHAAQEEREKDWLGRKPGQPFYGMPMPDVQVLEEMDEK